MKPLNPYLENLKLGRFLLSILEFVVEVRSVVRRGHRAHGLGDGGGVPGDRRRRRAGADGRCVRVML